MLKKTLYAALLAAVVGCSQSPTANHPTGGGEQPVVQVYPLATAAVVTMYGDGAPPYASASAKVVLGGPTGKTAKVVIKGPTQANLVAWVHQGSQAMGAGASGATGTDWSVAFGVPMATDIALAEACISATEEDLKAGKAFRCFPITAG